jgi:hypothetical protein
MWHVFGEEKHKTVLVESLKTKGYFEEQSLEGRTK